MLDELVQCAGRRASKQVEANAVWGVDRKGGKAMNCKKYEIMVSEDANFCEYCGAKLMSKRYFFPATCPYCKKESVWLFSADKVGENFVDCEHCGKTKDKYSEFGI